MKIEKINDRQIRCILTKEDLEDRKIRLSELVYGGEKARGLFRDMLMKAADELGFDYNNNPLMVEAVPTGHEQLVLIIGDPRCIQYMIDNNHSDGRYTGLQYRLMEDHTYTVFDM